MNVWCEVYTENLLKNIELIKSKSSKKLFSVVKANAYGLGLNEIASILDPVVDSFAVSTLEEALKLNTQKDILVLTPLCVYNDYEDVQENIVLTIDDEKDLSFLKGDRNYRIHIYVNTGMNRFGIDRGELPLFIDNIHENHKNISIEGIYTHLHNAKDVNYTLKQIDIFKQCVAPYLNTIENIHCLNSAGFLNEQLREAASFTNAFRAGNLLYGLAGNAQGFKEVCSFKTRMLKSFNVRAGSTVGYNNAYKVKKDMMVGVLPLGKIHKFHCSMNSKLSIKAILRMIYRHFIPLTELYFENKPLTVLGGTPNMDNTLIDATGLNAGDTITIKLSPVMADSSIPKVFI